MAMNIIWGKRPGVEDKYNALLLKMDRTYSYLMDKRNYWKGIANDSPLAHTRQFAKAKVSAFNILLQDLAWMMARNRDMINAASGITSKINSGGKNG